jgi:hypothetical protein
LTIISDPDKQKLYRLCVLRSALQLEIKGMYRRGRSAYAIVKEELNIRGGKERVLEQLKTKIKELEDEQQKVTT